LIGAAFTFAPHLHKALFPAENRLWRGRGPTSKMGYIIKKFFAGKREQKENV